MPGTAPRAAIVSFDLRHVLVVGDRACFELIEEIGGVNRHTQTLATLWNEGARILRIEDRDERAYAMNPIFEHISQVVNDFRSRSATPTSSSKTIV